MRKEEEDARSRAKHPRASHAATLCLDPLSYPHRRLHAASGSLRPAALRRGWTPVTGRGAGDRCPGFYRDASRMPVWLSHTALTRAGRAVRGLWLCWSC
eukprot:gene12354-biopygen9483